MLTLLIVFLQAFISDALKRHPQFIINALFDTDGEMYVDHLLFLAVLELVNQDEPITRENCPETLLLDLHRLRATQTELRHPTSYEESMARLRSLAFVSVNVSVHMERYQTMITKAWIMQ